MLVKERRGVYSGAMTRFFTRPFYRTIIALLCCALWGSAFPALKIGYGEFQLAPDDRGGLILMAGCRFLTASLLLLAFGRIMAFGRKKEERTPLGPSLWGSLFLIGLTQTTFQYFFFYSGVAITPGTVASVVNSSRVFFILILAHLFFHDDRINLRKALGVVLGMGGIFMANRGAGGSGFLTTGVLFILAAALAGSAGGIMVKKVSGRVSPYFLTGIQLLFGSLLLLFLTLAVPPDAPFVLTVKGVVIFFYTAFLSAVAFVLWSYLLKYNRAGEIGVYLFAIPLFGTVFSVIFLSEPFTADLVFSLLLVSAGIILVNLNSSRRKPKI